MSEEKTRTTENILMEAKERNRIIISTSVKGIIVNILLAVFKAVVGLAANSIAIVLDAVNNLTDALSSVITIVGTKLASKHPDKKHPLGYGRVEYLSAMIVSAIVLYAGITSGVESVKKIIWPETADYSPVTLIIIAVAVIVKIILGKYVKAQGKKVNSGALTASGADALFDAILSASVLASAVIFILTGVSLEAYVGVVIAVIIVKSGIEMMIETLNDILGKRSDSELSKKIKTLLTDEPEVLGAYDLFIYNYGPGKDYASVHLELPDTMTVKDLDSLTRRVQSKVYSETGIILTGIGAYSFNTKDDEAAAIRDRIRQTVLSHDWAIQIHGFYVDTAAKFIRFDVVMSFEIPHAEGLAAIRDEVQKLYPDYSIVIAPDIDISD